MVSEFSYLYYEMILTNAKKQGYKFVDFVSSNIANHNNKIIFLRHDIDISLEKALIIAELEKKHGIQATYFIMLTSEFYNATSPIGRNIIRKISDMGHYIGLHFDETVYQYKGVNELELHIVREATQLSQIIDKSIKAVSFHRPSEKTLQGNLTIPNMVNTYSKPFFTDIEYVADSRKSWRGKDIIKIIKSGEYQQIQLLVHPIWWNDVSVGFNETFMAYAQQVQALLFDKFSDNIRDFPKELEWFFKGK